MYRYGTNCHAMVAVLKHTTMEISNKHRLYKSTNVTLDHKTSLKSLGYICSNIQNYIVWVKIIDTWKDV